MEPDQHLSLPRRWIVALAGMALAVALVVPTLRKPRELGVYLTGARRLVGNEQIYRPTDEKAFTYPPFFALPFVPLTLLPTEAQRPVWWFCNLGLAAVVVYLLTVLLWPAARQGTAAGRPPIWVNVVAISVMSLKYLLMPLSWESHDLIVLALVLLGCYALAHRRDAAAGCWVGLATACKATPLLFLPLLVWQRRFVAAATLVVALVVATMLPDLLFPSPDNTFWVQHWHHQFVAKVNAGAAPVAAGAWEAWNPLNQSLAGTLHRWFTPKTGGSPTAQAVIVPVDSALLRILTVAMDLTALAWLAWMTRPACLARMADSDRALVCTGQTGAALCVMLLLSPMSSTYHFCALLVPIAFCSTYWMYREQHPGVGAVLVVHLVLCLGSAQDLVGPALADRLQDWGIVTLDTLLLLACSGYILGSRVPNRLRLFSPDVITTAPRVKVDHEWRARAA